ncbi:MAG: hypothetical protein BWX66_01886 [Deltaproteobacteria bacterium ADurb.Bin058]|nr:MAG: hypothetical protein BWX66_01886 [Deltaproteobacteria bacterium ADurb.Bin058]
MPNDPDTDSIPTGKSEVPLFFKALTAPSSMTISPCALGRWASQCFMAPMCSEAGAKKVPISSPFMAFKRAASIRPGAKIIGIPARFSLLAAISLLAMPPVPS